MRGLGCGCGCGLIAVEHYKGPVDESLYTRPGMRIKVEKEDGVEGRVY